MRVLRDQFHELKRRELYIRPPSPPPPTLTPYPTPSPYPLTLTPNPNPNPDHVVKAANEQPPIFHEHNGREQESGAPSP